MTRILLTYFVPLVLPTLIWFMWQKWSMATRGTPPDVKTPWVWLSVAGLVLLTVTLGAVALLRGYQAGSGYQSPHYEDGRIVGPKFTPPPDKSR